jgi:hypothetical protein
MTLDFADDVDSEKQFLAGAETSIVVDRLARGNGIVRTLLIVRH